MDCDSEVTQLPPRVVIGDTVRIRITQKVYEAEFNDCSTHLHGRVTIQKNEGFETQNEECVGEFEQLECDSSWAGLFRIQV